MIIATFHYIDVKDSVHVISKLTGQ